MVSSVHFRSITNSNAAVLLRGAIWQVYHICTMTASVGVMFLWPLWNSSSICHLLIVSVLQTSSLHESKMSLASVNQFCVVFRCLTENGWDYAKAAKVFMDLNVSSISECRHLAHLWEEGRTDGSVCPVADSVRGALDWGGGVFPRTPSLTRAVGFPLCLYVLLAAGGILC